MCTAKEELLRHDDRFSEALDDLLTLSLIKREKTTRQLRVHRLVQESFKHHLPVEKRQQAFNDAVYLLSIAFPRTTSGKGQLYDEWAECRLCSQHVLSLKNNFKESLKSDEPLKATRVFLGLLKNFIRLVKLRGANQYCKD